MQRLDPGWDRGMGSTSRIHKQGPEKGSRSRIHKQDLEVGSMDGIQSGIQR